MNNGIQLDIKQIGYQVGELYLCECEIIDTDDKYDECFIEVEILEIQKSTKLIKTDLFGWLDASFFHSSVKNKIGTVEYKNWLFFKQRIVTYFK